MFLIGVFGIESKQKEVGVVKELQCKSCEGLSSGKLYKTFQCFHFFFIPIIKWKEEYYVKCSGCGKLFEITKDKGKDIEKGVITQLSYWDLKDVNRKYENSNEVYELRICNRCGEKISREFKYCPHCGNEL